MNQLQSTRASPKQEEDIVKINLKEVKKNTLIEDGLRMDPFDERILNYLKDHKGEKFTVYQVANAMGTAATGMLMAKSLNAKDTEGYIVSIQILRTILNRLVDDGYLSKSNDDAKLKEYYYYVR